MKKNGIILSVAVVLLGMQNSWSQNLIAQNPGFEEGKAGWSIFVPADSKDAKCTYEVVTTNPHSGANCAKIDADIFARCCFGGPGVTVKPGSRYRFSAWVRTDANAEGKPGTPGALFRLMLMAGGKNVPDSWTYFIGMNSAVTFQAMGKGGKLDPIFAPLPKQWTKVEAVIEVPKNLGGVEVVTERLSTEFFTWMGKGTYYVDDVSVEEVPNTVPLTPLSNP